MGLTIDREALAWAAGFFDGEGCFITAHHRKRSDIRAYAYPKAQIGQSYRPILLRFQKAALGLGAVTGPYRTPRQPFWTWQVGGHQAVQAVVALLWAWLDAPKRAQAVPMLTDYLAHDKAMRAKGSRPRPRRILRKEG